MSKNQDPKQGKRIDGVGLAAELLNGLDPEHRKKLMDQIVTRDPRMAQKLGQRMFVFEDLSKLSDHDLQHLLKEIPNTKLVLALRRATPEFLEAIYRNMTARAGEVLRDEVATQGPKRVSDIQAAQADIVKVALRLEAEGKVVINR
jgi:flagellar motor switch protein FliG